MVRAGRRSCGNERPSSILILFSATPSPRKTVWTTSFGYAASRQDFYYERQLIKDWFNKDILAKPQ